MNSLVAANPLGGVGVQAKKAAPGDNEILRGERMRKTAWVGMAFILFSILACAQQPPKAEYPTWEIYGGYQFVRADFGPIQDAVRALNAPYGRPNVSADHRLNLTGGILSLQRNFSSRWAAVAEGGVMNGPLGVDTSAVMQSLGYIPHGGSYTSTFLPKLYTVVGGPQFMPWPHHKIRPFFRAMGGFANNSLVVDGTTKNALNFLAPTYATSGKGAAAIFGGGAERPLPLPFVKNLSFRIGGDYIISFLPNGRQTYMRASAGLVWRRYGRWF